jgi:hypothetical protein
MWQYLLSIADDRERDRQRVDDEADADTAAEQLTAPPVSLLHMTAGTGHNSESMKVM